MLLELCGTVMVDAAQAGMAPFQPERHPVARDPQLRERTYPIFLLAEALAQVACRTARAADPFGRRMLPVRIARLVAERDLPAGGIGGTLQARLLRSKPLAEFDCRLLDFAGTPVASATITVAPAEPLR